MPHQNRVILYSWEPVARLPPAGGGESDTWPDNFDERETFTWFGADNSRETVEISRAAAKERRPPDDNFRTTDGGSNHRRRGRYPKTKVIRNEDFYTSM